MRVQVVHGRGNYIARRVTEKKQLVLGLTTFTEPRMYWLSKYVLQYDSLFWIFNSIQFCTGLFWEIKRILKERIHSKESHFMLVCIFIIQLNKLLPSERWLQILFWDQNVDQITSPKLTRIGATSCNIKISRITDNSSFIACKKLFYLHSSWM